MSKMDSGSKVSGNSGLWSCIGNRNVNNNPTTSDGFLCKSLFKPAIKRPNQNQLRSCDHQGSLPSTPGSDCEEIDDFTALDMDTPEIIDSFLKQFTGLPPSKNVRKQVMSTMKRVVEGLIVKHELVYKGMVNRLNLDEIGNDMSFVTTVATELFKDGTNWGRISSLLAFGASVCKYLNDRGRSHCVSLVGEKISSYLLSAQRDWLLKNKAWDGFVEFFNVPDTEAAVRTTLMAIGSMATFGAALAYLIR